MVLDKTLHSTEKVAPEMQRDLAPHADAGVEWWFSQGYFENPDLGRFEYIFTFAQARPDPASPSDANRADMDDEDDSGWELLLAVTDPVSGSRKVTSRISSSRVRAFSRHAYAQLIKGGVAPGLARAFVDEVGVRGPSAPSHVVDTKVKTAPETLDLVWQNFRLVQEADGSILIRFAMPETDEPCQLRLTPQAPWIFDQRVGAKTSNATMKYVTCPRLAISGDFAGAAVTGQASFDHQWGGHNWFEPNDEEGYFLGWEWLAANLENGDDVLFSIGRNMKTQEPVFNGAVLFRPGQAPITSKDVTGEALDYWQSPDTFATYPVSFRFHSEALNIDLSFVPARPDCELPVYGLPGTVWEGHGSVRGSIDGQQVQGRGHGEFFGHGYIADFDAYQKGWIERIDAQIEAFLPKKIDTKWMQATLGPARWRYAPEVVSEMVSAPTWELISRGGKHWRAIFGILLLRALGTEVEPYEALVTVVPELLHAGSLMIDDIEDRSALRRGGKAIHHLYGEATTINAGNSLYFLPLMLIGRHPLLDIEQREEIYRVSYDLFIRAHMGQAQDLYSERWIGAGDVLDNLEKYAEDALQTYTFKTAAPVRALAQIACVVARRDTATTEACMQYAETAGIAYQIIDDVNNFTADPDWGKELGEDIREGRLTYVILRALGALSGADRQRLWEIAQAGAKGSITAAMQAEACALVARSRIPQTVREEAREMVETAWDVLCTHIAPSPSRTLLRLLVTRLFTGGTTT